MSLVVSNTSPLTNLAVIGDFDLPRHLFGSIRIAEAVHDELGAIGRDWPGKAEGSKDWADIHRVEMRQLVTSFDQDLDPGESETIALGIELRAPLVLMDEHDGRYRARRLASRPMGVIGVLLLAKERGLIPEIRSRLDALRLEAGFWLSESVYQQAPTEAGEQP